MILEFNKRHFQFAYTCPFLRDPGSNVASIAAGKTVGVAKEAMLKIVKVVNYEGKGSVARVVSALEYVAAQRTLESEPRNPAVLNLRYATPFPAWI